ncbi:stimulated by retinoic acid gene 6 protein-like isoform X4 [Balaenoptera musculus]|nr:stimulated by retinoic acid gene 6 protein-like isoform X4 [Balaenoptera musculus]
MIGTTVLAFICLYLFIVIEFCMFVYVRDELDVFEGELESYVASMNQTGTLTPVLLQVKELINVTKGVWVVTILPASLTCVSYLFHILACYRKQMKRLWAGDKHFLPLKFHNPSSSESVVAIARYSGWQIAYILWGYLIIHVMQSLCGLVIMYSLVLPVIHSQALEMLRGLGIGILTISIVLGLMVLQVWIAASFFLQPKMGTADKQKPLALNNRRAFHNFNYFLFFYNVLLGLGACLSRLLISCILGTWLIARIDRTILQSGCERADMGFSAWIGMLYVDHYHTNPVLVSFCHILITGHRERRLQQAIKYWYLNQSAGLMVVGEKESTIPASSLVGEQTHTELSLTATGMGNGSELTWTLVTNQMYRFSLTKRVFPEKATCLRGQRRDGQAFKVGDNKSKSGGAGLRRVSPLVYAGHGVGGWLDHPRGSRCQAEKPGPFSWCRGPSTYPDSSFPSIRSLINGDLSLTKPVQVPGGLTHRVREVPIHLTNPRAIETQ